jgi:uncharacterized protein YecE (DUF72 family)
MSTVSHSTLQEFAISSTKIFIGTAGWAIPKAYADRFPKDGTQLERYAKVFNFTEINRTFYQLPLAKTFAKWYDETPKRFRFSAKLPRSVTHFGKLRKNFEDLAKFFERVGELREKFYGALAQLPPSLRFEEKVFEDFVKEVRRHYKGALFIEPRHESWEKVDFQNFDVLPVRSDPPFAHIEPLDPAYFRLHGSPKLYYSSYEENFLQELAKKLKNYRESAVIFNNTAGGAAIDNALRLLELTGETQ